MYSSENRVASTLVFFVNMYIILQLRAKMDLIYMLKNVRISTLYIVLGLVKKEESQITIFTSSGAYVNWTIIYSGYKFNRVEISPRT